MRRFFIEWLICNTSSSEVYVTLWSPGVIPIRYDIIPIVSSLDVPKSWIAFFYAIPVNAIVLLSLRSAWHDFRWNRVLISLIIWGFLVSIYASLMIFLRFDMWRMFLLGIPGEIATTLWFRLFRPIREKTDASV